MKTALIFALVAATSTAIASTENSVSLTAKLECSVKEFSGGKKDISYIASAEAKSGRLVINNQLKMRPEIKMGAVATFMQHPRGEKEPAIIVSITPENGVRFGTCGIGDASIVYGDSDWSVMISDCAVKYVQN